jgi:hypothetical protein
MPYKDEDKRREYQREYMREWYKKNKTKHIGYVRNRDKKIKNWLKEYKLTLKCESCEENHPACLEFHHINPKEKKFSIGRINDYMSWKALKCEIEKCRVLCANCHRKEHHDQREKEQNCS